MFMCTQNAEVEAILHRICSATNTKTLDEALEEIRGVEESKMSLMRYINELTDTNRKLEEEVCGEPLLVCFPPEAVGTEASESG